MALYLLRDDPGAEPADSKMRELALARFKVCAALQMSTLGIPVIYYGEEVARGGGNWPTNRKDMPWGKRKIEPGAGIERDEVLRAYYKRLIETRRAHRALSRGAFEALSTDGDLLVFQRTDAETQDAVIVAVNRGATAAGLAVAVPAVWSGATEAEEIMTATRVRVTGGRLVSEVPPLEARIFVAAGR
jgi:alpha-amylase